MIYALRTYRGLLYAQDKMTEHSLKRFMTRSSLLIYNKHKETPRRKERQFESHSIRRLVETELSKLEAETSLTDA